MVNFDNDKVETVRQAAKREQVEELLGISTSARKSDKELFMNAYDAVPYKITGNVIGQGQVGLDFGDSPSDFAYLIYFPGGKSGYYQKSDAEQVSHEDFYEFYGIDEDSLDDDDFYDEEGASYSSKKTAAISKQPYALDSQHVQLGLEALIEDIQNDEPDLARMLDLIKSRLDQSFPDGDISQADIQRIWQEPTVREVADETGVKLADVMDFIFGGSLAGKKTAAITKQPFDLRPSSWNVDTNGEGMFLMQAQESRWEEENQPEQKQSGLVFRAAKKTAVGKEDVVPLFNNFYSSWVKLKSALADLTGSFDESGSFQAPGVREINVKMTDLLDQIDALIEESSKK